MDAGCIAPLQSAFTTAFQSRPESSWSRSVSSPVDQGDRGAGPLYQTRKHPETLEPFAELLGRPPSADATIEGVHDQGTKHGEGGKDDVPNANAKAYTPELAEDIEEVEARDEKQEEDEVERVLERVLSDPTAYGLQQIRGDRTSEQASNVNEPTRTPGRLPESEGPGFGVQRRRSSDDTPAKHPEMPNHSSPNSVSTSRPKSIDDLHSSQQLPRRPRPRPQPGSITSIHRPRLGAIPRRHHPGTATASTYTPGYPTRYRQLRDGILPALPFVRHHSPIVWEYADRPKLILSNRSRRSRVDDDDDRGDAVVVGDSNSNSQMLKTNRTVPLMSGALDPLPPTLTLSPPQDINSNNGPSKTDTDTDLTHSNTIDNIVREDVNPPVRRQQQHQPRQRHEEQQQRSPRIPIPSTPTSAPTSTSALAPSSPPHPTSNSNRAGDRAGNNAKKRTKGTITYRFTIIPHDVSTTTSTSSSTSTTTLPSSSPPPPSTFWAMERGPFPSFPVPDDTFSLQRGLSRWRQGPFSFSGPPNRS